MEQLRIAMVCDILPGDPAGTAVSTIRFAERLRAKGHHVILITAKDSRKPPVHVYNGIPVYQYFSIAVPGSNRHYFQSFPTKRALKKLFIREQIQIVHVMFPSYACSVAKKAARELGLGLVAHIHTQPQNILIFLPRLLRTSLVRSLILQHIVRFVRDADRILCPSEFGKEIYTEKDPLLPITVLSNGIDLEIFNKRTQDSIELVPRDSNIILYVGRLSKEKDPTTLIRAVPEIIRVNPSLMVRIVGTGPMEQELIALSKALGVQSHISFLGKVSDKQLLEEYRAATLFVLPSHVELEGMVVLEAMAYGLPLLISDASTSASRYFVQENGLLFTAGDSNDLAAKALQILGDNHLRAHMKQESLTQVQFYDIERSTETLEGVYRSVLN
ncbi:MAG: putative Glucosyltransferase [Parcubacteria group bacterium]|nr:putative Glucosyltransferase [Parcubacteria group bacterium]